VETLLDASQGWMKEGLLAIFTGVRAVPTVGE
jgi:hypothetical protein